MTPDMRFAVHEGPDGAIHYASLGDPAKPLMLCLHGFPEFWHAWSDVMAHFIDSHHVVAPDQRGFNLSIRPQEVADYQMPLLQGDMWSLADQLSPAQPFVLCGHDWGSAVAYAMAFSRPERISHLVVANGIHPVCFQRAIIKDEGQRGASQYMNWLRMEEANTFMAKDDFAKLFNMIGGFSTVDWMDEQRQDAYRAAWSQPGAMTSMLNWYRASPVLVPAMGEEPETVPLLTVPPEHVTVRMPHLVIWGDADEALRPVCLEGLDEFCAAGLTIRHIADAGHWILHEKADEVAGHMKDFLTVADGSR